MHRQLLTSLGPLVFAATAAAQFPASIALPGDLQPAASAGTQEKPALAFSGSKYLAVWEDGRSSLAGSVAPPDGFHANRDVYGVLLDAQGTPTQLSPFIVNAAPWDQVHVRVAWNGTHFLVVWESTRLTQFYRTQGVFAARVDANGQVLDDPPIVIDDHDDADERFPVVASDGNGWMVAWTDMPQSSQQLDGAYVDGSGLVLFKKNLVAAAQPSPTNYELAFAGGNFGLIFERNYSSGIAARLYDVALNPVGTEVAVAGSGTKPTIGSNGGEFYTAWLAGGVNASPMSAGGLMAFPGGVAVSGALSPALEVGVAWHGSGWAIGFSGYGDMHGALVDASGLPLPASPFTISSGNFNASDPVLANGNGRTLAVWTHAANGGPYTIDPFDIAGATIDASGAGGVNALSVSPPAQVFPAIAGEAAAGYLVAFQSRISGQVQVVAQRLSPSGVPLDAQPIVLETGDPSISGTMDVAWDGSEWLVVWSRIAPGGPSNLYRSFARRVSANGALPDPAPIDLQNGTRPVVASLNGEFLVASHFHYPPVQSNEIKHYKRVRGSDGTVLDPVEVPIVYGSGSADIIAFDDRWLYVWGNVGGVFILADGSVQTPFLAANSGSGSTGVVHAALARNGDEALLVWEYNASLSWNADVRARRIHKDGTLLDLATGSFVSSANNAQILPAVAWYGAKYMVSFTDYRDHPALEPGLGDVYAVRVSASNQILDVPEVAAQNRWPAPEGRTAMAGGAGRLHLLSCVLDSAPFGTWRIHRQSYVEAPPPQTYCSAKLNSLGCLPAIGSSGTPDVGATSGFVVSCANVRNNRVGLLLYGMSGRAAIAFQGGTLCVKSPIRRTIGLNAGGNPPPAQDCSGVFGIDMNAFAHGLLGGSPDPALLQGGTMVNAQWWGRDPGFPSPNNTTLSAGIEYSL